MRLELGAIFRAFVRRVVRILHLVQNSISWKTEEVMSESDKNEGNLGIHKKRHL